MATSRKRLILLVAALAVAASSCVREFIYTELDSSSGGGVRIILEGRDDPGILVEGVALDSDGREFGQPVLIGFSEDLSLASERFSLYQARNGDLVGIYREVDPGTVLMVVEFESRWILSPLGGGSLEAGRRGEKAIDDLSKAAGIQLSYSNYPVVSWKAAS